MGRRISSTVNNQTTLYAYDGWNVVEEYQLQPSSFILQTLHTWGLDLSGTAQGAGGVGGVLYTEDLSSGTAWHHHYDGNGNVTHLTDTSATSIASYTYDAFGNTETTTGPAAATNKYRFSTKPIDNTIPTHPLYYYGYRFYNPITGRWINRDPIEEKGGLNLYGFVGNDGVNVWDVLGHIEETGKQNFIKCTRFQWDIPLYAEKYGATEFSRDLKKISKKLTSKTRIGWLHDTIVAGMEEFADLYTSPDDEYQFTLIGIFTCDCCCKDKGAQIKHYSQWADIVTLVPADFEETEDRLKGWNKSNPVDIFKLRTRVNEERNKMYVKNWKECKKRCEQ